MTPEQLWEDVRKPRPEKMSLGTFLGNVSAVAAKLGEPEATTDDAMVSWPCEHGEVVRQSTPRGA